MATDTPRNVSLVVDPSTQNTPSNTAPKPPAGALFVDRRQTSSNGYRFRTVLGVERGIEGHDVTVQTACAQVADGSVDGGLVWPVWPPTITVDGAGSNGPGLTADQARELADVLHDAADELDGRCGR